MTALASATASRPGARARPVLVSHVLCPYVQRCVICAREKGVDYERVDVDLGDRPGWFKALSPLGKVPLLLVPDSDDPLFESDVICQYLDETSAGSLLPEEPLARGRERAWMAFASALLNDIGALYGAPAEEGMHEALSRIRARLAWLERGFGDGPWYAGLRFGLVDAAFAPAFRYFDVFETVVPLDLFADTPRLSGWRQRLAARASVVAAVTADYPERLLAFVAQRNSALARRIARTSRAVALPGGG